jgi:hypothetical protein
MSCHVTSVKRTVPETSQLLIIARDEPSAGTQIAYSQSDSPKGACCWYVPRAEDRIAGTCKGWRFDGLVKFHIKMGELTSEPNRPSHICGSVNSVAPPIVAASLKVIDLKPDTSYADAFVTMQRSFAAA